MRVGTIFSIFLFFPGFYFICISVFLLVYLCIAFIPGACRGQKWMLDLLEMELQIVMG